MYNISRYFLVNSNKVKGECLMDSSVMRPTDLIKLGIWPSNKKFVGEFSLLEIGYQYLYTGKNANMYFKPGCACGLMVRTDKTSVNDILLSDVIEGKGILQNKISNLGYDFAEALGIKTAREYMPEIIPDDIVERSQHMRLERAMEITLADGTTAGLELIFRKYLTGSLYKAYKRGEDPYGLELPEGLEEWHKFDTPVFTPTTKGVSDDPLPYKMVTECYPEELKKLKNLFEAYYDYAENRGIVLVDTKFEMFGGFLGDEVLTPESSRFILKSDFDNGVYHSMDKQILRDYAKEQGWVEAGTKGQLLYVTIPDDIKKKVLAGYQKVYDMLAK